MSLNFSIDSILRHGNVDSTDSTLLSGPGKLGQTSFLDESTSAFLKQQQLNYLTNNVTNNTTSNGGLTSTNGLTANSSNPLIGDAVGNSLLQSQLLYLNNKTATNAAHNSFGLMNDAAPNGTGGPSSLFGFGLSQLGHLNPLELSQLTQLNQLNQLNQLRQFHYLSKINSLYGDAAGGGGGGGSPKATANRPSTGEDQNHHPNSSNSHSFSHFNHQPNNHLHSATENSTAASFLSLANGSLQAQSIGSFNASQCSPLSDKSSEMLLNYEDSSDSNRLSQHSGNNMSINSNNSTNNAKQSANNLNSSKNGGSAKNKDKDFPLCTKCKLHGIHSLVKGHKKTCPKKDCMCELCILTDYGKRLRGKKSKKAVGILPETVVGGSQPVSAANQLTPANLFMMDSLNEQATSLNHLSGLTNLNGNLNSNLTSNLNSNLTSNLSETSLLTSGNVSGLQSTTPNSNSNSSCSNLSNAALAAAASSLRNNIQHPPTAATTSTATRNSAAAAALSQPLAGLHSAPHQLAFGGLLDTNSALKNYNRIVIHLLKEKLAQDGLNYEQELSKLKITVIYLLLNRFDKSELYKKLAELTNS